MRLYRKAGALFLEISSWRKPIGDVRNPVRELENLQGEFHWRAHLRAARRACSVGRAAVSYSAADWLESDRRHFNQLGESELGSLSLADVACRLDFNRCRSSGAKRKLASDSLWANRLAES
jgi:hypothetical protein